MLEQRTSRLANPVLFIWQAPPPSILKMNVATAYDLVSGASCLEVVIRNSIGGVVLSALFNWEKIRVLFYRDTGYQVWLTTGFRERS